MVFGMCSFVFGRALLRACLLQTECDNGVIDMLITVCGRVNKLTLQSTLTTSSIWDHDMGVCEYACVEGCVWVCAGMYQEMGGNS